MQQGGGSGKVPAALEITPLEGLKSALPGTCELIHLRWDEAPAGILAKGNVEWSQPANAKGKVARKTVPRPVKPDVPALCAAAQAADAVIFIAAGNRYSEGMDQRDMELPDGQGEAIDALARANPNVAVVLVTAGAVNLEPWVARVPALLAAWYAGQSTGDAIADVLTGKVNPAGKLSFTFGRQLNDYPCHALNEWNARLILAKDPGNPGFKAEERKAVHAFDGEYKEGVFVGYRWFDEKKIKPAFPFGHGLSYTKFALSQLAVDSPGDSIRVAYNVRNTGDRAGAEVVQVYVAPPKSSVPRPPRELKGFAKVSLKPGESRQADIELRPSALAFYDVTLKKWKAERGEYEIQVGVSSRDIRLRSKLKLAVDRLFDHF